jgi:SAM-dependent methyltransferase
MDDDYVSVNQAGWNLLAASGCDSSRPYGEVELGQAASWLDDRGWLPWDRFNTVLCLAAGGGQQGPLFAALGYDVTVADLSAEQLSRDRAVADEHGLTLQCVQADMLDLSALPNAHFDLIYQPVSAIYVPDVRKCYEQVARVSRKGGLYFVEHWNPVQMQLSDDQAWDGEAYRIVHRPERGVGRPWTADGSHTPTCYHYIHPLDDLIGGLTEAGFSILRFGTRATPDADAEAGTTEHLASYLPTFFSLLARLEHVP